MRPCSPFSTDNRSNRAARSMKGDATFDGTGRFTASLPAAEANVESTHTEERQCEKPLKLESGSGFGGVGWPPEPRTWRGQCGRTGSRDSSRSPDVQNGTAASTILSRPGMPPGIGRGPQDQEAERRARNRQRRYGTYNYSSYH